MSSNRNVFGGQTPLSKECAATERDAGSLPLRQDIRTVFYPGAKALTILNQI
jgi:hypothetical protein